MTEFMADCLAAGLHVLKAHGTENDFVVLPDDHAEIALTPELVRGLCDRRAGLGADGILRVARGRALTAAGVLDGLPQDVPEDWWFMDYRNADGSVAEMCGNGVRVFAHVLVATGRADAGTIGIGTRAGARPAEVLAVDGRTATIRVDMGTPEVLGVSTAELGGHRIAGLVVDVGNPHLACVIPGLDAETLAGLPVDRTPAFDTAVFPEGANLELATPLVDGRSHMRVHERGAGETRSCGTGVVATAVALLADTGEGEGEVEVRVPGGTVQVALRDGRALMTGPSSIVAGAVWCAP